MAETRDDFEVVWSGSKVGPTGTKGELLPMYESKSTIAPPTVLGAGYRTVITKKPRTHENGE